MENIDPKLNENISGIKTETAAGDPAGLQSPLFLRSLPLIGESGALRLQRACVAVFGLGGVGSYAAEALARCGIGAFELIDHDRVEASNLNRQLIATSETVGRPKVELMKERIEAINPHARVRVHRHFYHPDARLFFTPDSAGPDSIDYIVDAMDTVTAKIDLIEQAKQHGIPLISAMGAGNKLDPTRFRVCDLFATQNDPLARVMRRELRKRGITEQTVVFSDEPPACQLPEMISSISFVPPVSGMICASVVIRSLIAQDAARE